MSPEGSYTPLGYKLVSIKHSKSLGERSYEQRNTAGFSAKYSRKTG